uniref:Uncharacterized protein n=1 Tax=Setaria viridis TaxID=4556 RepID=A0A4U6UZP0_SETVI|nr:hypothetical protein SEVIR_4G183801v2 [Setaria viridis]TKW21116.1 hypothetical protein SEVIR_4G183801v2 [Setaria viridis]
MCFLYNWVLCLLLCFIQIVFCSFTINSDCVLWCSSCNRLYG